MMHTGQSIKKKILVTLSEKGTWITPETEFLKYTDSVQQVRINKAQFM